MFPLSVLWLLSAAVRVCMLVKTVPSKWAAQMAFIKMPACLVAHCLLVFLNEFLLLFFLLHPVLTWNDKVRCDQAFWAGVYDLALKLLSSPPLVSTLETAVGEDPEAVLAGVGFLVRRPLPCSCCTPCPCCGALRTRAPCPRGPRCRILYALTSEQHPGDGGLAAHMCHTHLHAGTCSSPRSGTPPLRHRGRAASWSPSHFASSWVTEP